MMILKFEAGIAAPVKKVWDTMLNAATYREWTGVSWPGSFYEGKWEEGEQIRFISDDGSGILGKIEELIPYEYVLCIHVAILNEGGVEDTSSELAREWIGISESYRFIERNESTELTVQLRVPQKFAKMFEDGWPKALKRLKEMCEP